MKHAWKVIVLWLVAGASALAQQTSGNVTGRILDQQGAAIPGVTVTAKNAETGLSRSEISDSEESDALVIPKSTGCASAGSPFSAATCSLMRLNRFLLTISPISSSVSPDFTMRTLESICRTMISMSRS